MVKRYSLEALKSVREHTVVERQQQLAGSLASLAAAEAALRTAELGLRAQREELEEEQRRELRRASAGVARVADFQNAKPFRELCELRVKEAEQQLALAQRGVRTALEARAVCERELAEARAEAKLLEQHREDFVHQQRLHQEIQVEELAVEAWAAARITHKDEH